MSLLQGGAFPDLVVAAKGVAPPGDRVLWCEHSVSDVGGSMMDFASKDELLMICR